VRDGATGAASIAISDAGGKVIRTLHGPAAKGINRVTWDLRYASPIDSANAPAPGGRGGGGGGRGGPPAAVPVGFPGQVDVPGFGRGGPPAGPFVMPGTYTVSVAIPGSKEPLIGKVSVEADPLPKFNAIDRAARQTLLMNLYAWTHSLGEARTAVRALASQRDAIKSDIGGAQADSLNARIGRLSVEIDLALNAVSGQRQPIESWSGLPSADQRASAGYAVESAAKAVAALNKLVSTEIPGAYKGMKKTWSAAVKTVSAPGGPAAKQ
jgi:hypothetical protein